MYKFFLILTPVVFLAWPIFHTLAFFAPYGNLRNFALATVKSTSTDGLQVWMGILGSCARLNYSTPITCTKSTKTWKYDLSSIIRAGDHGNIPRDYGVPFEVARPTSSETGAVIFSLTTTFLLLMLLVGRAIHGWTKKSRKLNWLIRIFVIASVVGPCVFVFVLVKFSQAVKTFNLEAEQAGNTKFIAKSGVQVYYAVGVVYFLITLFVSGDLYLAVKPAKPTLPAKPLPPKPLPAGPAADKISNISDSTLVADPEVANINNM